MIAYYITHSYSYLSNLACKYNGSHTLKWPDLWWPQSTISLLDTWFSHLDTRFSFLDTRFSLLDTLPVPLCHSISATSCYQGNNGSRLLGSCFCDVCVCVFEEKGYGEEKTEVLRREIGISNREIRGVEKLYFGATVQTYFSWHISIRTRQATICYHKKETVSD